MIRTDLVMIVTSDISGQVRGKGFPVSNLEKRLKRGMGWVPTNVQITCLNSIAESPYGSVGDLILVPDEKTEVKVDFEDNGAVEHFFIGDILHLDGSPWECCTRGLAQKALADLEEETGLFFNSTFEHEFFYTGADQTGWNGFGLESYRKNSLFAQTFVSALEKAGVDTDTFLPEFGPGQFEVTTSPCVGIRSADQSLILREVARATADRFNERVSFSPMVKSDSVGNGVHIHFSLLDRENKAVTYDRSNKQGLGEKAGMFCAGVLKYMPAITALMAPGVLSYQRLTPHKWSAAFNNLAVQDREAGLRICPVIEIKGKAGKTADQYNLEYRAADASASPYLQIAALVRAGLQGIKDQLPIPEATQGDLSLMSKEELEKMGVTRLPQSLDQALELFENESIIKEWFPGNFQDVYLKHKYQEIKDTREIEPEKLYALYGRVY
ncbi:glutamine synthetase family protein [Desulfospira joergensenii]|uniref:glutamine synthetase family protein n=1 Tax=Desulfospira joergensenii TaxID=53329 RepID=UPI0003B3C22C|nr:glutamine synthetase family protein [Desulfospira joergensenii]